MNIKSIKPSTIDKDGSAVIELSGKELGAISTFLSMEQSNCGFDNDTEFELYVNMYLAYNLVYNGGIDGMSLITLRRILSNQKSKTRLL